MIVLKDIRKTYSSNKAQVVALENVNLTIKKGEIFGIIGYSGAGKSTLIRLINHLEKPTSGEVWIENKRMDLLNNKELNLARQEIGMIFQQFNLLWSRTVKDNIALPLEIAGLSKSEIDKRVVELMQLVGLHDKADAYPSELSGGQKQRVGIARALANNPKVLLSDESTSALDPKTTDSILKLLREINQKLGITIVLITHEMHVIKEICHRVAVIEAGYIVEEGPVYEVFTHPKQEITKEFVKQVTANRDSGELISKITHQEKQSKLLKCSFLGEKASQPIINKWMKAMDIEANILEGKIQTVQGSPYGTLYIEVSGAEKDVESSVYFLRTNGVEVEEVDQVGA